MMTRFVQGRDRSQGLLLPPQLDEYITDDNPVRVVDAFVDAFVDALDLTALGFDVTPAKTGRPSYHPTVLLKIYLYGYLNRIASSRRLERETQRNLELIWLTEQRTPDFKTIADFRRDNGPAICKVCSQFVQLCRQWDLLSQGEVAIDGSKFKAVNNRDKNFTDRKLQARIEQIETNIARYLDELDRADRQPELVPAARVSRIKDRIESLKEQIARFQALNEQLQQAPDRQISLTDTDARSMATSGRGTGMVGYNVQAAVDTEHHLIVAHEVTNVGHDRSCLSSMAQQAKQAMGTEELTALADKGYFSGTEILACEHQGVVPLVPKPLTSGSRAEGRFDKRDFIYLPECNEYQCPAGQRAIWRCETIEKGMHIHKYWSSACPGCSIKDQCTTGENRRIARWEHEDVLERMQKRLDERTDTAKVRRRTVEHVFGTLKAWMGATHFLTKGLKRVQTEMSLHVLAYNLKRMMNMIGVPALVEALQA